MECPLLCSLQTYWDCFLNCVKVLIGYARVFQTVHNVAPTDKQRLCCTLLLNFVRA
jgi:hypothetical protein